jgi:hypothetical protein
VYACLQALLLTETDVARALLMVSTPNWVADASGETLLLPALAQQYHTLQVGLALPSVSVPRTLSANGVHDHLQDYLSKRSQRKVAETVLRGLVLSYNTEVCRPPPSTTAGAGCRAAEHIFKQITMRMHALTHSELPACVRACVRACMGLRMGQLLKLARTPRERKWARKVPWPSLCLLGTTGE